MKELAFITTDTFLKGIPEWRRSALVTFPMEDQWEKEGRLSVISFFRDLYNTYYVFILFS